MSLKVSFNPRLRLYRERKKMAMDGVYRSSFRQTIERMEDEQATPARSLTPAEIEIRRMQRELGYTPSMATARLPVGTAPATADFDHGRDSVGLEQTCRAQWGRDPALRAEFGHSFDRIELSEPLRQKGSAKSTRLGLADDRLFRDPKDHSRPRRTGT